MARARELYRTLKPRARRGGDRSAKTQNEPLAFADRTAAATGRSKAAINRAAARGEQIGPDVLAKVRGTKLDYGTFLDKIARLSSAERITIVDNELAELEPATKDVPDINGDLARLRRVWAKTCLEAKELFLDEASYELAVASEDGETLLS